MTSTARQHRTASRGIGLRASVCVLMLVLFLIGATSNTAHAVDHIANPTALQALCQHAQPITMARYKAESSDGIYKVRSYLEARQARLLKLYSVDVDTRHFKIADYSESTNLLTLVAREQLPLFDGSYTIKLRDEPLLAYEVESKRADTIKMAHGTERAVLRLFFILDAVHDPKASYCSGQDNGEPLALHGRLVASRIWSVESAGQEPRVLGKDTVLATQRLREARTLENLVGQRMDGGAIRAPKVQTANIRAMKGVQLVRKHTEMLARDAELLLLPCFLRSLEEGGPHETAMTLETWFTPDGYTRDSLVTVDASGSPTLCKCVSSQLRMLYLEPQTEPIGVRLNIFFNQR